MTIREAIQEDIPNIVPVWRELMEFHAQRDPFWQLCEGAEEAFSKFVSENIEKDDMLVLVAESDGMIAAYCQCQITEFPPVLITKQYGHIIDLAVLTACRQKGIGDQLVTRALQWFHSKGLQRIEVRVAVCNEVSTRFWRKMGFQTYLETMYKQVDLTEQT